MNIKLEPSIKQEPEVVVKTEKTEIKLKKEPDEEVKKNSIKSQNCPICLCNFGASSLISSPEVCQHIFCLECLQEWSKKINTCPIDRKVYNYIIVKNSRTLAQVKKIKVEDRTKQAQEEYEQDLTYCEVCRQPNREDRMLLCDACDKGYHCECLTPSIDDIPEGEWFCPECVRSRQARTANFRIQEDLPTTSRNALNERRVIARTNFSERVRRNVNENRRARDFLSLDTELPFPPMPVLRVKKKKRTIKRKKVKRINKKTTRKRKIRRTLNQKIKIEPGTSEKSVKRAKTTRKRKRKTRRVKIKRVSRAKGFNNLNKISVLNLKKKYKLTNKTPKERILNRIITQHEKKFEPNNAEKLGFTVNGVRPLELDEDAGSVQLTAQTSHYFDDSSSSNKINTAFIRPSTSSSTNSSDFLDSIMQSQQLLTASSSKIKVNNDGSMKILNKAGSAENKLPSSNSNLIGKIVKPEKNSDLIQASQNKNLKTESVEKQKVPPMINKTKTEILEKHTNSESLSKSANLKKVKSEPLESVSRNNVDTQNKSSKLLKIKSESLENNYSMTKKIKTEIPETIVQTNHSDDTRSKIKSAKSNKESSIEIANIKSEPQILNPIIKVKSEPLNELANSADVKPTTSKGGYLNEKQVSFNIEKEPINTDLDIQEKIASICKAALKPFYINRTINKDDYKMIMKKVVTKVKAHIKDISSIHAKKITELALAYVEKVKIENQRSNETKNLTIKKPTTNIKKEIEELFENDD